MDFVQPLVDLRSFLSCYHQRGRYAQKYVRNGHHDNTMATTANKIMLPNLYIDRQQFQKWRLGGYPFVTYC